MEPDSGGALDTMKGFETSARVLRYQLLAKAAQECDCFELLSGHHADDQAETIMFRLMSTTIPPMTGLRGMQAQTTLPGAWDIYGAHNVRDEQITVQHTVSRVGWLSLPLAEQLSPSRLSQARRFNMSIFRPLLNFAKARLQETCRKSQTEFVIDISNFSVQLTPRNAIRHIRTKYQLPRALSAHSLLHLAAVASKQLTLLEVKGRDLFKLAGGSTIDLRSGYISLVVTDEMRRSLESDIKAAGTFLAKLVDAVSSGRSDEAAKCLAPTSTRKILFLMDTAQTIILPKQVYVVATSSADSRGLDFARERFRRSAEQSWTKLFEHDRQGWSKWVFWENRFWLRIQCRLPEQVASFKVWPLRCSNVNWATADSPSENALRTDLLRKRAGHLNYIPVITKKEKHTDSAGHYVLPTMSHTGGLNDPGGFMASAGLLNWQIHYKAISMDIEKHFTVIPRHGSSSIIL